MARQVFSSARHRRGVMIGKKVRLAGESGRCATELLGCEADPPGEDRDVDAPFVFAAEPGRRAIDHDLPLPEPERAFVQQAAGEHPGEDARAFRHGAEQHERLDARRHDALERLGDGGFVGRFGGGDAGHATVYVVTFSAALHKM